MNKWFQKLSDEISSFNPMIIGIIIACAIVGVGIVDLEFAKEHLPFYDALKDLGSFFAAMVALVFGLLGERIRKATEKKPKIKLNNMLYYKIQQTDQARNGPIQREYYRLMFVNGTNVLAKKVQIRLEEIRINGIKKPFIPTPFRWTHANCHEINIYPKQIVYLDFIFTDANNGALFIINELSNNLSMIQIKNPCEVKISCYGKNFEPIEYNLVVDFNHIQGAPFPNIDIFQQ